MTDDLEARLPPETLKNVAELATHLAVAREKLAEAKATAERANSAEKHAAHFEKAAYKAFNEAVAAMRPRRKTRAAKAAAT